MERNRFWLSLGVLAIGFAFSGCGGAGGSASSFRTGQYNGTAVEPGRATDDVQLSVFSDGTVKGVITVVSSTSGAIMGKSTVNGTVDLATRTFHVTGFYQAFMPPPPNGTATGIVNVDGTLPVGGVSVSSITVDDNGTTYPGHLQLNIVVGPA